MNYLVVELLFFRKKKKGNSYFLLSAMVPKAKKKELIKACKKIAHHFERRSQDRGKTDSYLGMAAFRQPLAINPEVILLQKQPIHYVPETSKKVKLAKKINILAWFVCQAVYQVKSERREKTYIHIRALVYCSEIKNKKIIENIYSLLSKKDITKSLASKGKVKLKALTEVRSVYQGIYLSAFEKRKLNHGEVNTLLERDLKKPQLLKP